MPIVKAERRTAPCSAKHTSVAARDAMTHHFEFAAICSAAFKKIACALLQRCDSRKIRFHSFLIQDTAPHSAVALGGASVFTQLKWQHIVEQRRTALRMFTLGFYDWRDLGAASMAEIDRPRPR